METWSRRRRGWSPDRPEGSGIAQAAAGGAPLKRFKAAVRGLLYVFCFRGDEVLARRGWEARCDALCDANRWAALLGDPALDPLRNAPPRVLREFAAVARRAAPPLLDAASLKRVSVASKCASAPGYAFFPFDPCPLRKAAAKVEGLRGRGAAKGLDRISTLVSADYPRRRDSFPRNIHVAAAASPRLLVSVSTSRPRLRAIFTSRPRRRRDSSLRGIATSCPRRNSEPRRRRGPVPTRRDPPRRRRDSFPLATPRRY